MGAFYGHGKISTMARLCSKGMDVQRISWLVLEGHDLHLASNGQQWLTIDSIGQSCAAMVGHGWPGMAKSVESVAWS